MKLLEKIDWDVLNTYIDNNLIVSNKHPEYDIWILNYSPKAQYNKFWDEYTISCRGLVIDADGNILARPFQKFKNYEEYDPSEIDWTIPFEAFEKMDGSLIIVFYYGVMSEWIVASRGSFISEQAQEASKMLNESKYRVLDKDNTYIFEILYPENRIVVNYGNRRELVLLTRINTKTGSELPYNDLVLRYSDLFSIVKKVELKSLNELLNYQKLDKDNEEGIVVRFTNGFRFKLKFSEYCRLHVILTNVSNITVWEHLMKKYDFDALSDRVPDEMYAWLKNTISKLQSDYNEIERITLKEFMRIYYINNITTRKEFAMEALKSEYHSILFSMYDKKSYEELIWKRIRPVHSKPFRDGYEYIA